MLGRDPGSTLRGLVHPGDLPKVYGGEMEWTYQDSPNLDADTRELIGEMPHGPRIFVDGKVVKPEVVDLAP